MKKIILIAALVLGFAAAASAQPKAIGLRIGGGAELSYQHNVGANFIEADLGLESFKNLGVAATYNFSIAEFGDGFKFYAGPGIGLGFAESLMVGVAGQAGVEYNFASAPVNISVDVRPYFDFMGVGLVGWYPHIGVRYNF
ncbi:MAG: hypothetical protein IKV91_04385 [Bacteroidales bacterium]|jgi:hypothetical protein|nr:hypothetical protein [Bacteroidales bacterium]